MKRKLNNKILLSQNLKRVLTDQNDLAKAAIFIDEHTDIFRDNVKTLGRVAALKLWYSEIDRLIEHYEKKNPDTKIACKKGCSFCCHLNVDMTNIEGEVILDYCKENDIKIDYDIFRKQLDLDKTNRAMSEFSKCGFLGDDNLCKIYPARPMNCRTYFVVNDPELCDTKKYPEGGTMVVQYNHVEMLHLAIATYSGKFDSMQRIMVNKKSKSND